MLVLSIVSFDIDEVSILSFFSDTTNTIALLMRGIRSEKKKLLMPIVILIITYCPSILSICQ